MSAKSFWSARIHNLTAYFLHGHNVRANVNE